ncbi:MAG: tRNA dimethylallyltransferase [Pilosibacter sp.]
MPIPCEVYRHMDIGSAKVTKEEMNGVRHHLIDVLDPWDEFNVVVFQRLAKQAMEEICAAGHIPHHRWRHRLLYPGTGERYRFYGK